MSTELITQTIGCRTDIDLGTLSCKTAEEKPIINFVPHVSSVFSVPKRPHSLTFVTVSRKIILAIYIYLICNQFIHVQSRITATYKQLTQFG